MNLIERAMTARDRRFVVPTWVRSSRYSMPIADRWKLVDRVLDRNARVIVLATDERTVHAWACAEGDVLHYAYVPPELRGEGLARRAITAALGSYADRIIATHPWPRASRRFRHNPHALLRAEAA